MSKRKTTEVFIEDAICKHMFLYNYKDVVYYNNSTKVKLWCLTCGDYFYQSPSDHLSGKGCKKCGNIRSALLRSMSQEVYLGRVKEVHGDKYEYNKTKYINSTTRIIITCLEHGDFLQLPRVHLTGGGCRKCSNKRKPQMQKLPMDIFLMRSREKHSNFYGYTKVFYTTVEDKVTIICPKHGEFIQKVWDHLNGHGCSLCGVEKISGSNSNLWKGGVTKANLPLFNTYAKKLQGFEKIAPVEKNGFKVISVECYYCKGMFIPTRSIIDMRYYSIIGTVSGENNFYCSDECKQSCVAYGFTTGFQVDPRSTLFTPKTDQQQARSCQTDHLKQLQLDEFNYHYCEKCGQEVESVDLHHTLEVSEFGLESINSAGHMLVCIKCHKELTKQCRDY